jgi:signal transduction histidine kinase
VLINLVDNAIKYTPDGGTVHIGARGASDGADVELSVVDSGAGIPSQDLPRLTERFFASTKRGHASSAAPGSVWRS